MPLSASCSSKDKECVPLSPIPSTTCSNSIVSDEPPPLSPQQPPTTIVKKDRISKKLCKELNACKVCFQTRACPISKKELNKSFSNICCRR